MVVDRHRARQIRSSPAQRSQFVTWPPFSQSSETLLVQSTRKD
jgi:hypothetical protein